MRSVLHFKRNINLIPKLTNIKELKTKNPLLQRTYATSSLRSSNQIIEGDKWNLRAYIEKLFTIPRGFKKFYPKEKTEGAAGAPKEKHSSSPKNDSAKSTEKGAENTFKSKKRQNSGPKKDGDGDPMSNLIPIALTVTAVGAALFMMDSKGNGREVSWQEFQTRYLEKGLVKKIVIANKSIARVELYPAVTAWNSETAPHDAANEHKEHEEQFAQHKLQSLDQPPPSMPSNAKVPNHEKIFFSIGSVDSFERKLEDAQAKLHESSHDYVEVIYQTEQQYLKMFVEVLPTFILLGLMFSMMRGVGGSGGPMGNIFKVGKSTATMVKKEDMKVTFKDVAGCDEAKKEVMEFVEFLKTPEKFKSLGAKVPRGALLAGPPGTGKTLLAKATAGEANVPFFSISGSDFVEMFVGVGASRVRDLFKEARAHAPCIIFIDEIDAVGRARGKGSQGGHDERENTLNQLLIEMDGFNTDASVIMLAGTNRADMLDSALTRPGRFDRTIAVELPDIKGRKAIFDVHLKGIKLSAPIEEYSPRLAALTPGFSGADIANICNEAAIHAGRKSKTSVDIDDFESATDRIIGGLESNKIISPEEKRIVAIHEAGHAVAGWYLEHASPLLKVTIVPRSKGSLGYAQYLPKEVSLRTEAQVMDIVCMALAGRAAELVHFGKFTTGASDDLNKVRQIMYQLVQVYGMNEKIGQLAFPQQESQWPQDRPYSEATAELMDEEVRILADKAFKRTVELMEKYHDDVKRVADLLIKQETISHSDVANLIGDRQFSAGKEYDEFVATKKQINSEAQQAATKAADEAAEAAAAATSTEEASESNNSQGGAPSVGVA